MSVPLTDDRGDIMFRCAMCWEPMTQDDFFELGLRLPDQGEWAEDYREAELIDRIEHARCLPSQTPGTLIDPLLSGSVRAANKGE